MSRPARRALPSLAHLSLRATAPARPRPQLYVNNLNDRIKKAPLKTALYAAFAPHGSVVDIVATRTKAERGQAWVAFADVAAATAAMHALQGFPFYGKPMRIAFAREKSHAIAKLEGSFQPAEAAASKKRKRESAAAAGGDDDRGGGEGRPAAKVGRVSLASTASGPGGGQAAGAEVPATAPVPAAPAVPSKMLLVQGLAGAAGAGGAGGDAIKSSLQALFGAFHGLVDVRVIAERGLAFVEFASEAAATPALQALHNFKMSGGAVLGVSFAR